MNVLSVFDILVVFCGIYMAVNGVLMKTKNKINASLVLGKNIEESHIRDKAGFINYMWWKLLAIGIVCSISGVANIILGRMENMMLVSSILNIVFFAILVVYGVVVSKAQKKFL